MGFKLKSIAKLLGIVEKHSTNYTPVFKKKLDKNIAGEANRDMTIYVDKDVSAAQMKSVVKHEQGHIEQMMRGDLDYDTKNVYWKGKTIARKNIKEGAHNLPWEKEIYKKQKKS